MGEVSCVFLRYFVPERECRFLSPLQLLVPLQFPLFVLLHLQFELVGCDDSVFIPVLVVEHVSDNLLYGHTGLYTTFSLCHLLLDELPKLEGIKEEPVSEAVQKRAVIMT